MSADAKASCEALFVLILVSSSLESSPQAIKGWTPDDEPNLDFSSVPKKQFQAVMRRGLNRLCIE